MLRELKYAVKAVLVFTVILGIIYPLAFTLFGQIFFKYQADGSPVYARNGAIKGSLLIGQNFVKPEYFHPRPSFAGGGYDAGSSGGSNLGPTNKKLVNNININIKKILSENPGIKVADIPVDAVTSSASGLDPHISPEYAKLQALRIAKERELNIEDLNSLIDKNIEDRTIGFIGERRVNVLVLNIELDKMKFKKS